ncbi:hypothetical protein AMECASPLE_008423 [Ameca splendens]|uniref:Uncharacterized protein n=1 Tax=Ameca splendens TaxID=208324 RepID=A0ABV0ZJM4_9TELE
MENYHLHLVLFSTKKFQKQALRQQTFSIFNQLSMSKSSENNHHLSSFPKVSLDEVQDIVRRMKLSTCSLDRFLTTLVKTHISALGPLMSLVARHSLQTRHVPHSSNL